MVAVIQPSFAAGEVSDRVQARVDLTKRTVAVEKGLNAVVSVTGSLDKRPGTEFIDTTYANDTGRLVPFKYNRSQTYVLVFTDARLEVYREGVQKASIASPYAIADVFDLRFAQYGDTMTIAHEDYAPRELTRSADTSWAFSTIDFVPQQAFPTEVRADENKKAGTHNVTAITKATPGVVTVDAAHGLADNDIIQFGEGAGMTMVELQGGTFKIDVNSSTTFRLLDPEDGSSYSTVGYTTYTGTSGNANEAPLIRNYAVTAVNAQTGEESIVGTGNTDFYPYDIDTATPCGVFFSSGHGLLTGDEVTFTGTSTVLDGERFIVTRVDNLEIAIAWANGEDVDGSDVAWSSGGYLTKCFAQAERALDDKWDNEIFWTKAADAVIYNVYASDGGAYGLIGSTTRSKFRDFYIAPDTSIAPPVAFNPFFDPAGGTDRYPRAVAYHDQRRVFGYSNEFPNRFWMSQVGNYYNMAWSTPTQDDDAIVASIASSEINDVEYIISLSELILLTGGAEFMVGGGDQPLTPATVSVKQQSAYGAGGLPPLVAGNVGMLHLNGNVIRNFEYSIASGTFGGVDLTVLARHLLDDRTLNDWAYAHSPGSNVVLVPDDAIDNPVFTFFPEQEVFGWTRWETDGDIISVCSVPEGGYDRLYAIVKRDIGGTDYYCIERFALPSDDPYVYHGVDCGVDYESTAHNITDITVAAGVITVTTATAHGMTNGDIADISEVRILGDDGVEIVQDDFNGDGFVVSDATTYTFKLKDADGAYIDGSSLASYSSRGVVREAVTTVGGLSHLNGETVVAAANGAEVTGLTVSGGQITLSTPASQVHVGYPFTYEAITLPVSAYGTGGTIEGVMKNINKFALHVISAADFWAGPDRTGMVEYTARAKTPYTRQTMMNKSQRVTSRGTWDRNRSLMLQQRSPLPMSIASIIPDAQLGEM